MLYQRGHMVAQLPFGQSPGTDHKVARRFNKRKQMRALIFPNSGRLACACIRTFSAPLDRSNRARERPTKRLPPPAAWKASPSLLNFTIRPTIFAGQSRRCIFARRCVRPALVSSLHCHRGFVGTGTAASRAAVSWRGAYRALIQFHGIEPFQWQFSQIQDTNCSPKN